MADWVVTLAFGVQALRYYLIRPICRAVKWVLDWGARNFWLLAFLGGFWYYTLEKSGAFESQSIMAAYLLTEYSFFGIHVTMLEIVLWYFLFFLTIWIYREMRDIFWHLVSLAKRWIARVLLVSLYLLYRVRGKECEAVYYLNGPPTLKERLVVYGAMGGVVLIICGIGYIEVVAALQPL